MPPRHPIPTYATGGLPETERLPQMWKTGVYEDQLLLGCLGISPVTAAPPEDLEQARVQIPAPLLTRLHSEPQFPFLLSGDNNATSQPRKFLLLPSSPC